MKRYILTAVMAAATAIAAHAIVVQHVILKNGSMLHGFVQQAANGVLTFHSDKAMVVVGSARADITDQPTPIARLDSAWVAWATANDAFDGTGNARTLTLNTIILHSNASTPVIYEVADSVAVEVEEQPAAKASARHDFDYYLRQKRTISGVHVLERGAQLRYLEQTPNDYTFTWDDVASIRTDRRPRTALTGIDCTYELRNGRTYEGQPAGETRTTLSLYIDGSVQSFNIDDVVKYTYHGINPNQDIIEQSELLDVVRKHSGAPVRGVIIEQNYSSNLDKDNYVLIKEQNGAIQSVRISEVAETMKEANPAYHPLSDVLLEVGQVVVNRQEMKAVGVSERDYVLTLDSLCRSNVIAVQPGPSTTIAVEYRTAEAQNVEMFRLVRLTAAKVKKNTVYTFSYKDLSEAVVRPSAVTTSVNQTTRAEYIIPSAKAVYALYNDKTRTAIPIIIKQ
jgi:hypothetical protein